MIAYSIVIPHKNIPKLLQRCLDSIPQRPDLEVIEVDDDSDPDIVDFDHFPGQERPDTTIIFDKSGKGAGHARNIGMDHAHGKWLLFADADDFFVEGMYDIISLHRNSEADIIYFKKRSVLSEDISQPSERSTYLNNLVDEYLLSHEEIDLRVHFVVPYCKILRKEFVEAMNFRYDETPYSNDAYFSVRIALAATKIEAYDVVLYVLTVRKGSLVFNWCEKPGELEVRTEVAFRIQKLFRDLHIDIEQRISLHSYLMKLLRKDRTVFYDYWRRIDEAYPSKWKAFLLLSKKGGLKFKAKLFLYSMWVWLSPTALLRKA